MEQLNHLIFIWINATPASPQVMIKFATFMANDMIMIVPLLIIGLWLWGEREQITSQRTLVSKTVIGMFRHGNGQNPVDFIPPCTSFCRRFRL